MKQKLLFIFALLCTVAQGAWASYDETKSINTEPVTVPAGKHYFITGTTGETTSNQITLENGATVTLSNVKIENEAWCLHCNGNATIILADGTTNTLTCTTSHSEHYYNTDPALWVGDDGTLTIQGTGTLNAQGGEGCAAIGGGWKNYNKTCGNIVIEGGIINATGGVNAAGIGADYHGKCGTITITGGIITATGGEGAAGIGCGNGESGSGITNQSRCGDITITNGVTHVTATRGGYATHCIGKGSSSYTFCAKVTINGVVYWDGYEYLNGGATYLDQNTLTFANINKSGVTISGHRGLITGTGETTHQITLEGTSTVTLDGVNIKNTDSWCMHCNGEGTVILKDGTTNGLTSRRELASYPALWVGDKSNNAKLTIKGETAGTGKLIAKGAWGSAAIGGGAYNGTGGCGDIEIQGGIIEATGGEEATAIGADKNYKCGDITITNGVTRVTATKGDYATHCIGKSSGETTSCGTVTIGGIVYYNGSAYQNNGEDYLGRDKLNIACVNNASVSTCDSEHWLVMGKGESTSNQITIGNDATVTLNKVNISNAAWCILCNGNATVILADGTTNRLTSGNSDDNINPALRAGNKGSKLTIKGETAGTGKLIAQGANSSAAIGGGWNNGSDGCGDIEIQGGIIEATGGASAAAIGADLSATCGNITISGGTVTATGGTGAAGIGCGQGTNDYSTCGDITINGGTVTATGGQDAPGIGTGDGVTNGEINHNSVCGDITITNDVTCLIAIKGEGGYATHCIGRGRGNDASCGRVTIGGVEYWDGSDYKNDGLSHLICYTLAFLKANEGAKDGEYWTTFCYSGGHIKASEGTKVFEAALSGNTITLTEITDRIVNDGQGVILKSTSPNFFMKEVGEGTESEGGYEGNCLQGTSTTITNPGNAYVLNKNNDVVGFYKLSATGTIGAHKAYLTYSGAGAREFFLFDEATGISATLNDKGKMTNEECFDLQGRKVAQPSKGLYIKDGKKYIKM